MAQVPSQTLQLSQAAYNILASNETDSVSVVGGATNTPNLRFVQINPRVQSLDLRIQIRDIQDPLPPRLSDLQIGSVTINGRAYEGETAIFDIWQRYYAENYPQQAQAIAETTQQLGKYSTVYIDPLTGQRRSITRHTVKISEILVPNTNQTLDQLLPLAPTPVSITLPTIIEPALSPLPTYQPETQPSVIAVDLNEEGELVTTLSDSTQEIVGAVIETTLPSGSIISFYGNFGLIPEGWVLCDGTNDTPDLSASFIIDPDPDRQFFYIKKI